MQFVDYYQVLGVEKDATADEVKRVYRKLARKYHPDVSKEPDAEKKFKEVAEAYEVLKDPEKRAEFDQLRKYGGTAGQEFRPPPGWQRNAGFRAEDDHGDAAHFSDFFSEIFGGRAPSARAGGPSGAAGFAMRGEDYTYRIEVSLEEAYSGGTRSLSLSTPEVSSGGRLHEKSRTLTVKIPAGVTDGQKIRLKAQGGSGIGGASAGDLYLEILIAPHRRYTVEARDINLVLPISPWEAVLGAKVEVPTLGGSVQLSIPAGAKAGQRLRLKGRGLPGNPPGDQYVVLEIAVPTELNEKQRELFEQLRASITFNPRSHLIGEGHEPT
jgi:curved DNA-binding protein